MTTQKQPEAKPNAGQGATERATMTAEPRTPLEVAPGVTVTLMRDHPTDIVVERTASRVS